MQALSFLLTIVRFFLIGMTQTQSQQIGDSNLETPFFVVTNLFAFLFFSQIIDNLRKIKTLFIVLEVTLFLSLLSDGIQLHLHDPTKKLLYPQRLGLMLQVAIVTGYTLILLIQLFNWFSKKYIGSVIGLYLLAQGLGFYCKFSFIGQPETYPDERTLLVSDSRGLSNLLIVLSFLFLALAIADVWIFVYHPFEMNIVIDLE